MEVNIQKLRIFAMAQRIKELKEERVLYYCGGRSSGKRLQQALLLMAEETKNVSCEISEFNSAVNSLEYIDGKKINRASRRGNREGKRKKNFNHYSTY